jgi:hydroxyethylthiazole kinase-like uncharacterized protein yjeF
MLHRTEFRVLDINSEFLGVAAEFLMENAGRAVAAEIVKRYDGGIRIAVVCGTGNNGGDGFVAARYLYDDAEVDVFTVRSPESIRSDMARNNFEKVRELYHPLEELDLANYDVVVDSLFGTGMIVDVTEPYLSVISLINSFTGKVVSVDTPSGLGANAAVRPDLTVTFHDVKEGMDNDNSGEIVVVDIGIPPDAERFVGPGEFIYYPIPKETSHKGQNGNVLVIGGGPYVGAPVLAGLAAYRIGADLVHIATPRGSYVPIASRSSDLIVHPLSSDVLVEEDVPKLAELAEGMDAVLIGPGLGRDEGTAKAVRAFVQSCSSPLVIDADAIDALAGGEDLKGCFGVVTPHANEFELLSGKAIALDMDLKAEEVTRLAAEIGMTVLLKGRMDIISDGQHYRLNQTGNPSMTVGGTGDVLAGLTVGLLSKGVDPFYAARMAAFVNGLTGDRVFEEMGYGLMASDLLDLLPKVLMQNLERVL